MNVELIKKIWEECAKKAINFGDIKIPQIRITSGAKRLGSFQYPPDSDFYDNFDRSILTVSKVVLTKDEDFIQKIIQHEFVHCLIWKEYPSLKATHPPEFFSIYRTLFGEDTSREIDATVNRVLKEAKWIGKISVETLEESEKKLLLNLGNLRLPKEFIPKKLYLGTYAIWYRGWEGMKTPVIEDKGLVTGIKMQFGKNRHNRSDSLYFATTSGLAMVYARLYPEPMILEIDTSSLDKNKFYYDPDGFENDDGTVNQLAYRGNVPAHALKVFWKAKQKEAMAMSQELDNSKID